MASAQVVETSVSVTTNSPSKDYTHTDDHTLLNYNVDLFICRNVWSESEYESSDDEATGAEKILEVMDLPYKDQPHAKGDSSYIVNEEDEDDEDEEETEQTQTEVEVIPSELEKRDKNISEDFSELIKIESKAGKLNKDVVYLNIASMKSGDIFVSTGKWKLKLIVLKCLHLKFHYNEWGYQILGSHIILAEL